MENCWNFDAFQNDSIWNVCPNSMLVPQNVRLLSLLSNVPRWFIFDKFATFPVKNLLIVQTTFFTRAWMTFPKQVTSETVIDSDLVILRSFFRLLAALPTILKRVHFHTEDGIGIPRFLTTIKHFIYVYI